MRGPRLWLLLIAIALGTGWLASARLAPVEKEQGNLVAPSPQDAVAPDQYVMYPQPGVTPDDLAVQLEGLGATVLQVYRGVTQAVAVRAGEPTLHRIEAAGLAASTEPDALVWLTGAGEQEAPLNYGLDRIDQPNGTDSRYRWSYDGTGVDIFVVDTGIRRSHVEFGSRVATGVDLVPSAPAGDCQGHGTHVAGIAAGNSTGVAKNARIVPVRAFGCELSAPLSTIIAGLEWILENRDPNRPAVVNLSLGTAVPAAVLDRAVDALIDAGFMVVAAAGNDNGADACQKSPARVDRAITVGSSFEIGVDSTYISAFSNAGSCVDLYAPGEVVSAWIDSDVSYFPQTGTSMATPFAAGVAAQYLERAPAATPREVHEAIAADSALVVRNLGVDDGVRFPMLQTTSAEFTATASPSRVPRPTVARGDRQVTVQWRPPARPGAGPVTSYIVQEIRSGREWTSTNDPAELTVAALPAGEPVQFRIAAMNAAGQGPWSHVSLAVAPYGPPGPPTDLVATPGNGSMSVVWNSPISDGFDPIIGYTVSVSPGGRVLELSANHRSALVDGVSNGVAHTVTVAARHRYLAGAPATVEVTPSALLPGTPRGVELGPGDGWVNVRWAAPEAGPPPTGYRVTVFPGNRQVLTDGPVTSVRIGQLDRTRGYQFAVTALTGSGSGAMTTPTATTTPDNTLDIGARGLASRVGIDQLRNQYYVTSTAGEVTLIDGATHFVASRIPIPTSQVQEITVDEQRGIAWVTSGDATIGIRSDGSSTAIATPGRPRFPTLDATGRVWVPRSEANHIDIIDPDLMTVVKSLQLPDWPRHVALDETRRLAYVVSTDASKVTAINMDTLVVESAADTGTEPFLVAVDSRVGTVYVVNDAGSVSVFTARLGSRKDVDLRDRGWDALGVAIDPNGSLLFASDVELIRVDANAKAIAETGDTFWRGVLFVDGVERVLFTRDWVNTERLAIIDRIKGAGGSASIRGVEPSFTRSGYPAFDAERQRALLLHTDAGLLSIADLPSPPPTPELQGAGNGVVVSWQQPTEKGQVPITGYRVSLLPSGPTVTVAADQTSVEIAGLDPNVTYRAVVAADTLLGPTQPSAESGLAQPGTAAPTRVDSLSVTGGPAPGELTVNWRPPTSGRLPTGYEVRISGPTKQTIAVSSDVTSYAMTGGSPYFAYVVSVRAVGPGGTGPWATAPPTRPFPEVSHPQRSLLHLGVTGAGELVSLAYASWQDVTPARLVIWSAERGERRIDLPPKGLVYTPVFVEATDSVWFPVAEGLFRIDIASGQITEYDLPGVSGFYGGLTVSPTEAWVRLVTSNGELVTFRPATASIDRLPLPCSTTRVELIGGRLRATATSETSVAYLCFDLNNQRSLKAINVTTGQVWFDDLPVGGIATGLLADGRFVVISALSVRVATPASTTTFVLPPGKSTRSGLLSMDINPDGSAALVMREDGWFMVDLITGVVREVGVENQYDQILGFDPVTGGFVTEGGSNISITTAQRSSLQQQTGRADLNLLYAIRGVRSSTGRAVAEITGGGEISIPAGGTSPRVYVLLRPALPPAPTQTIVAPGSVRVVVRRPSDPPNTMTAMVRFEAVLPGGSVAAATGPAGGDLLLSNLSTDALTPVVIRAVGLVGQPAETPVAVWAGPPRQAAVLTLASSTGVNPTFLVGSETQWGEDSATTARVRCTGPGVGAMTGSSTVRTLQIRNLVPGVRYTCTGRLGNAAGLGPESSGVELVPAVPPLAPRGSLATWGPVTQQIRTSQVVLARGPDNIQYVGSVDDPNGAAPGATVNRLTSDAGIDPSFSVSLRLVRGGSLNSLVVDRQGRLLVGTSGGDSSSGQPRMRLYRYLPSAILDPSFGEGRGYVEFDERGFGGSGPYVFVADDGSLRIVTEEAGSARVVLYARAEDGSPFPLAETSSSRVQTTFTGGLAFTYITGSGDQIALAHRLANNTWVLSKLSGSGVVDRSWGTDGITTIPSPYPGTSLAYGPDGSMTIGGVATEPNGQLGGPLVFRVTPEGQPDLRLGTSGYRLLPGSRSESPAIASLPNGWLALQFGHGTFPDQTVGLSLLKPDGTLEEFTPGVTVALPPPNWSTWGQVIPGTIQSTGGDTLLVASPAYDAVSGWSSYLTIVTLQAPRLTAAPGGGVAISAEAPRWNGGRAVTNYRVRCGRQDTNDVVNSVSATPSFALEGLIPGVPYDCAIAAVTEAGVGEYSVATTVRPGTYAMPSPTVTARIGEVAVEWTPPDVGSSAQITGYSVMATPGGATCSTPAKGRSCLVSGLSGGIPYQFKTVALGASGTLAESPLTEPQILVTVPGAPAVITVVAGNRQVTVSWVPPASDGGSPVTGYVATATPGGATCTTAGSGRSCVVDGLDPGVGYSFSVVALNLAGQGLPSAPSQQVFARTVPSAPTLSDALAGNRQVTVSWVPPASDGGSSVTGYEVRAAPGGAMCATDGSGRSCVVDGLDNGVSYSFRVRAMNAAGASLDSVPSDAVIPRTVPGAPILSDAVAGNRQVAVSWLPPASDGGSPVTGYVATATPGGATCTTAGSGRSCVVDGLDNGVSYSFGVRAINAAGEGPESGTSVPVAPRAVPGVPTLSGAVVGNRQVTVSWVPPGSDGGSSVTGYEVRATPGGAMCATDGSGRSCVVGGLDNGASYAFRVRAVNAAGAGLESVPSDAVTPRTMPGAPTLSDTVAGNRQVTVSWVPPGSDGGSSVTGYEVRAAPGGATCTTAGSGRSCVVDGLDNGMSYSFGIRAINAAGTGPESTPSGPVTPRSAPGAPSISSVTAGDGMAVLSWTAPSDTGGLSILGYVIWYSPDQGTTWFEYGDGPGTARSMTVTGLGNGIAYRFRIVAVTEAGVGRPSESSASVTPLPPAPGQPGLPRVTPMVGALHVTVTPPSTGGTPAWYRVATAPNGGECMVLAPVGSCTITGLLETGTFRVSVVASNMGGASPVSPATPAATPSAGSPTPQFADVAPGKYFTEATSMLKLRGITTGVRGTDNFNPDGRVTRAEMAAFLYRMAGQPTTAPCAFKDQAQIPEFARSGACWLLAQGITTSDPYNPSGLVTRSQMAAFLYRLAGQPPVASCSFQDQSLIPAFAQPGACWLLANGITTSDPYAPANFVTRAQMAAFLYRAGGTLGYWVGPS